MKLRAQFSHIIDYEVYVYIYIYTHMYVLALQMWCSALAPYLESICFSVERFDAGCSVADLLQHALVLTKSHVACNCSPGGIHLESYNLLVRETSLEMLKAVKQAVPGVLHRWIGIQFANALFWQFRMVGCNGYLLVWDLSIIWNST